MSDHPLCCEIHDHRDTSGRCSCSEIVERLRADVERMQRALDLPPEDRAIILAAVHCEPNPLRVERNALRAEVTELRKFDAVGAEAFCDMLKMRDDAVAEVERLKAENDAYREDNARLHDEQAPERTERRLALAAVERMRPVYEAATALVNERREIYADPRLSMARQLFDAVDAAIASEPKASR